jgi:hypothetical protein
VGRIDWRVDFGDRTAYLFGQFRQFKCYSGSIQNLSDMESFDVFPIVLFLSVIFT